MGKYDILYILLIVSTLLVLFFSLSVLGRDNKKQIHYAVLGSTASVVIWDVAVIFNLSICNTTLDIFFEQLYFFGPITVSVSLLFLGLIFAHNRIEFTWKYMLLFIPPLISLIILFTNQYHHLFYSAFSLIPSERVFGLYFTIHSIISYIYIVIGLLYLGLFSLKSYGFFSRQSILIFLGVLVAIVFDSFSTLKIFDWPTYLENIVFAFTIICFIFAIIKYDFLNIIPIALETVVNSLTDSYVVISDNYQIIDYNRTFEDTFTKMLPFKRKDSIIALFQKYGFVFNVNSLVECIKKSIDQKANISLELQRVMNAEKYYYRLEIIPLYKKNNHLGTTLLMRDITENKKYIEQITTLNKKLQDMAMKDWLTQAYNRLYFDERLQQEIDRVYKQQAYGQGTLKNVYNFGLIIFDIDHFKEYNDNNGHLAGDKLLQTLVRVLKSALFPTDVLCRYGGEEFAIICCETTAEGTALAAEKIRKIVENYKFDHQETQPGGIITISAGVAYYSKIDMKKDDLVKEADANLYLAKGRGRNKIVC